MKPVECLYPGTNCFFCGRDNPRGLKLTFAETEAEPPELVCEFRPDENLVGLGRVLHGGIQGGLFDEIMGWTAHRLSGQKGVTRRLEIDFERPLYVGQKIEVRCRIETVDGPEVHLSAEIKDEKGRVSTRARGVYHLVDEARFWRIVGGVDQTKTGEEGLWPADS